MKGIDLMTTFSDRSCRRFLIKIASNGLTTLKRHLERQFLISAHLALLNPANII